MKFGLKARHNSNSFYESGAIGSLLILKYISVRFQMKWLCIVSYSNKIERFFFNGKN